jgi:manganese efflux pump family protein
MPIVDIVVIAIALSVDAFAVSTAASAAGRINNRRAAGRIAFHFGFFQFLMPVLGWAAGATLEPLIESFDHWIAFVLLSAVGIRMIRASRNPDGEELVTDPSRGLALVTLSTAVSIDALAVGLSLAMLKIEIWTPSVIIGLVTAFATLVGVLLGRRLSSRLGKPSELIGGIVLILVAFRIVVEHLSTK